MIIDIGSGHKPHRDADILLEYVGGDDEHRWNSKLKIDRPTVIYDGKRMPFKNKAFDFSICRHTLEHVHSPKNFLTEIERISSAGYIETPSEISELIFTPYKNHKWIIYLKGNKLLIKKKITDNVSKFGKLFDYLYDNERKFGKFFYDKRRALFLVEYTWKDKIRFNITESSANTFNNLNDDITLAKLTKLNTDSHKKVMPNKTKIKSTILFDFLEDNLMTPCCNKPSTHNKKYFLCSKCHYKYPIKGNRIDMYVKK